MKEFFVKDYIDDKEFCEIKKNILLAKDGKQLIDLINRLDEFVSKETVMDRAKILFDDIDNNGYFAFDYVIKFNKKYLKCEDNLDFLIVYFHEKRHHLQYLCYLNGDKLLGEKILEEIRKYFEDICVVSKKNGYSGLYGLYGSEFEVDAYEYCFEQLLEILKVDGNILDKETCSRTVASYKNLLNLHYDSEFEYFVEKYEKKFEARKIVEEMLLESIREQINNEKWGKEIKKIIYSKRLFECLNDEEKKKINFLIEDSTLEKVKKSEIYLEKIIKRSVKKQMRISKKNLIYKIS